MQKTFALVLKKQNLGETDRILTIFTPTLGKRRVIAKAVRKPLSKLSGHLDTFMLSQIMLTDEPDLPKITSAVLIESFEELRSSYPLLQRAFAVSRIVERVILEDMPQQSVFQLTVDTLLRINNGDKWLGSWLYFLSTLTNLLGLPITDFTCERCGNELAGESTWLPDQRCFRCQTCGAADDVAVHLDFNALKLLRLLGKRNYTMIQSIAIPQAIAAQVEEVLLREITQWLNKSWRDFSTILS